MVSSCGMLSSGGSGGSGGTGVQFWLEAEWTAAPNDTKYATSWTPSNAAANVDAVISPKGTGALLAQVPDGTTAKGNKRGDHAVDLQTERDGAAKVASGLNATIPGGYGNTASGNYSFASGYRATASGVYSFAHGDNSIASQQHAVAMGRNLTASGSRSQAFGDTNTASGYVSFASGLNNQATAQGAAVVGGESNLNSGVDAFIGGGGGGNNIFGGNFSAILGGINNYIAGYYCVAAGDANTINTSCSWSSAFGRDNVISNQYCAALGQAHTVSGVNGIAIGNHNTVDANGAVSLGGYGLTRGIKNSEVHGFNHSTNLGQRQNVPLYYSTPDATPRVLTSDFTSTSGADDQMALPDNSAYLVTGRVVARQNTTGDTAAWTFTAHIRRGSGAASTALVAAVTPTLVSATAGAAAWSFTVTADTTNGALSVTVTGEAAKTIRWAAYLDALQVVG